MRHRLFLLGLPILAILSGGCSETAPPSPPVNNPSAATSPAAKAPSKDSPKFGTTAASKY